MNRLDPHAYGPSFGAVLDVDRCRALGRGQPNEPARPALEGLTIDVAFASAREQFGTEQPVDRAMAKCCLAGAWLLHDFLDESHTISQGVETPEGSFWHGIMHRREGDFSNAKYWMRRVGRHPVFEVLGQRAGELSAERGESRTASVLTGDGGSWEPLAFVDLVASVERGSRPAVGELCRAIQQVEWERLFDFCYQAAIGRKH